MVFDAQGSRMAMTLIEQLQGKTRSSTKPPSERKREKRIEKEKWQRGGGGGDEGR